MANISMKFILLLATVAVVCNMCSGFEQHPGGFQRPLPLPWNHHHPNPRPLCLHSTFRREAAIEPTLVNDAAEVDELVRQAREAPEETVYVVESSKHYYTN